MVLGCQICLDRSIDLIGGTPILATCSNLSVEKLTACQAHGSIDEVEDISGGDQPVLVATRLEAVSDSGELPSFVELVMCTLSEEGG